MKIVCFLVFVSWFSVIAPAQSPGGRSSAQTPQPTPVPTATVSNSDRLETAMAATQLADRIKLLEEFIAEFPESPRIDSAMEMLTVSRAARAEKLFSEGNLDEGVRLFKTTFQKASPPWSDRLFVEVISRLPAVLFFRGYRADGLEIASEIESQSEKRPDRLLMLAGFYLSIEDGVSAKRLAESVISNGTPTADAYIALGMAERLEFDLAAAAKAYETAIEIQPDSAAAIRGLADMKRATGKSEEALKLYRRLLQINENDSAARTGVIMSLFETGKREEAEADIWPAINADPRNLALMASAAYWYAAAGDGQAALEMAGRAMAIEPRYIWAHIVAARGFLVQQRPAEAERVLMAARKYGNFPTLSYEIALARLEAGFFKEAVEELRKGFTVENGTFTTRLGLRIERSSNDLAGLIAAERQASIFVFRGPDDKRSAEKLAQLFRFAEALRNDESDRTQIGSAARLFIEGDDAMKPHRQIFVAATLLENRLLPELAREITIAATGNTDAGLAVVNPAAAVMADALYEGRNLAFSRDQYLLVPEVPRSALSAILRGRVEDLVGWSYMQQEDFETAALRLRRAVSVLPEKSIWWRASKWRLGEVLAAEDKDKEALENYIAGYDTERPEPARWEIIESLYFKVHDSHEGLVDRIGPKPTLIASEKPSDENKETAEPKTENAENEEKETGTENKEAPEPEPNDPVADKTEDAGEKGVSQKQEKPEAKDEKKETPAEHDKKDPADDKNEDEEFPENADPDDETVPVVTSRQRVVKGVPVNEVIDETCSITVSQENVSIAKDGGSVGIIVSIDGEASEIRAVSSSPDNVEIDEEPDIVGVAGRAFFVVRSKSAATGDFKITFSTPCGKKEISVRVR